MSISSCKLIDFPKIGGPQGTLTFMEGMRHLPFEIKRVYYMYHLPDGARRGAHAHKYLQQLIIPLAGSFNVRVDDGRASQTYVLDNPWTGLYIPPLVWRELSNFSSRSICLAV